MSTKPSTIAYLIEQTAGAGPVSAKPMFGEYAVYLGDRLVALVCDDAFYLKPTTGGRILLGDRVVEASPYPGAKPCFLIDGDTWDDADTMAELIRATAAGVPPPRPKPVHRPSSKPSGVTPAASPRRGRRSPGRT